MFSQLPFTVSKKYFFLNFLPILFILFFTVTLYAEEQNFLVLSDMHLGVNLPNKMEIQPHETNSANDLDLNTWQDMLQQIVQGIHNKIINKPNFILILGDLPTHMRIIFNNTINNEKTVFTDVKKIFPDIPIFYIFGNNDSLKENYGSFRDITSPVLKSPYDIAVFSGWKSGFLSTNGKCNPDNLSYPCVIKENINEGYYSAYIAKSLRLLGLNSVAFSERCYEQKEKIQNQLGWFKDQLAQAKNSHEEILIAMHIPPGNNIYNHSLFWRPEITTSFLKIIAPYQKEIIGILSSHTHTDEIKFLEKDNQIVNGIYFTPALSTSHGNAPAIKSFKLHKYSTWELEDYQTFYFRMMDNHLVLALLYDYKKTYCVKEKGNLLLCLANVTEEFLKKYYTSGNSNYPGSIAYPEDLAVKIL